MTASELLKEAEKARENAYAPYSHYKVGACLLSKSGKIYYGCNIENSAFGPSVCAERCAIFKAVSENCKDFEAIAIVGGEENCSYEELKPAYPCGVCRQVMSEFCQKDFKIYCGTSEKPEIYTLEELLPKSFAL